MAWVFPAGNQVSSQVSGRKWLVRLGIFISCWKWHFQPATGSIPSGEWYFQAGNDSRLESHFQLELLVSMEKDLQLY